LSFADRILLTIGYYNSTNCSIDLDFETPLQSLTTFWSLCDIEMISLTHSQTYLLTCQI